MALSGGLKWNGMDTITSNLKFGADKANKYLAKTTTYYSLQSETYAKKGAKWTDRSTNARSGLTGVANSQIGGTSSTFTIELYHKVKYGIYLEVRKFSKRGDLSIIKKTIDYEGPRYFKMAEKLIDKMFSNGD